MDDLSPDARALLDRALPGLEPSDDARARIRSRVAARVAVGVAAGVAAVAVSKSTAGATAAGATAAGASAAGASAAGASAAAASVGAAGAAGAGLVGAAGSAGAAGIAGAAGAGLVTKVVASLAVVSAVAGGATYSASHFSRKNAVAPSTQPAAAQDARSASIARAPRADPPRPSDALPANPDLAAEPAQAVVPGPVVSVPPSRPAAIVPTPPVLPAPARSPDAFRAGDVPSPAAIAEEAALLKQANHELAAGRPERALAILDDHVRRFPRGGLVEEREAARVLALCGAGRHAEGRDARTKFLRAHPRSLHRTRVQNACVDTTNGIQREFPQ